MDQNIKSNPDNDYGVFAPVTTNEECSRAFQYCVEHLEGAWRLLKSCEQVEISRLRGGLTNLLYRCALRDDIKSLKDEPREVLLRLYGPSQGDLDAQVQIFKQLATERLGPVLYKAFAEGRFEEYLPSRTLTWNEVTDISISSAVARKLAAVHKLGVECIDSESKNWLIDKFNELNEFILNSSYEQISFNEDALESTKKIANELLKVNFKEEIDYMDELFRKSAAPLVFSHNDLHQNNILLLNETDEDQDFNDRVVLIDFEYCSYNYRPFDMANHLMEWCFDYTINSYPKFSASLDRYPSLDRQRQFLRPYIEESCDIEHKRSNNLTKTGDKIEESELDRMVESLLEEMQPFHMASNLLWALWAIRSACTSKIKFGYWEMAKWKWDVYLYGKNNFKF